MKLGNTNQVALGTTSLRRKGLIAPTKVILGKWGLFTRSPSKQLGWDYYRVAPFLFVTPLPRDSQTWALWLPSLGGGGASAWWLPFSPGKVSLPTVPGAKGGVHNLLELWCNHLTLYPVYNKFMWLMARPTLPHCKQIYSPLAAKQWNANKGTSIWRTRSNVHLAHLMSHLKVRK